MITNQGFVLVQHENSETGEVTMVPFFPYVLNSSIICEDPIMIDEHLHLTSERWTIVDGVDSVDKTSYIFSCNYGDLTEDETGELIGSSYLASTIQYDLYRNGYMDVEINARLNGVALTFGEDKKLFLKTLYLPYAIPEKTMIEASCLLGQVEGVTVGASLRALDIKNKNLNPTGLEKNYFYGIDITEIVPLAGGATVPLDLIYRSVDESYAKYSYEDYISRFIPIKMKISGIQYK